MTNSKKQTGRDATHRPVCSILLIARHFPPLISGGARRPYLLVKALCALGVRVEVIAPKLPSDVSGIEVWHPHPDPSDGPPRRPTLRDHARSILLWPDPEIRWARRAAAAAIQSGFRPDWLITTSPPESIHAVAPALKARLGCGWAADFRDEWLTRPFLVERRHPLRKQLETILAKRILRSADIVLCVDDVVGREIGELAVGKPVQILRQFSAPPEEPTQLEQLGPNLVYTGSFSLSDPGCDIAPTLCAFEGALAVRPDLTLHIAGRLTHSEREKVAASTASASIILYGPLAYREARRLQAAADGFIVTAAPDATAIPGKVFEYRAVGCPIIAIGDGPWRQIGGYKPGNPIDQMVNLKKYSPSMRSEPPPETADQAARHLISALENVV